MSINQQLEDGMPLEDYIEQNQDNIELPAGEISQDTWLVYNEHRGVRVAHRDDDESLEACEFMYDTFYQLKNELDGIVSDEGRYNAFVDENSDGKPQHVIYDSEETEVFVKSDQIYSLHSRR